jgi:predicted urease superfamily metal-dependent hydrolase
MADGLDLVVDPAKMERMSNAFRNGEKQLEDIMNALIGLANTIDNGALVGKAGDEFAEVLRNVAKKSINEIMKKFGELAVDIDNAVAAWEEAKRKNIGLFGG